MTAAEYLYDLRKRLKKLPPQEIDQAMSYYEEYFAEAGPSGEAELINRMGTPAQVASTIISEYAMKDMSGQTRSAQAVNGQVPAPKRTSSVKTMWIVIIAVLASPIAIPLAIGLFAVVFAVLVAVFSVFLSLFASALAMVVAGLATAGVSVVGLFASPLDAFVLLGVGLICLALGMALGLGTIKLSQLTIKGITWIFAKLLGRKGGQR